MTTIDGTCDYVLDPDDPGTWGGDEGDHCYVDDERLDEAGVWVCPHDAEPGADLCVFHLPPGEKPDDVDLAEAFRRAVESDRPPEFVGAVFDGFDLAGTTLSGPSGGTIHLEHARFVDGADWRAVDVEAPIDAEGATFEGDVTLDGVRFGGPASFRWTTLEGRTEFSDATFEGPARFDVSTFEGVARFDDAVFGDGARFMAATFERRADFGESEFRGRADFHLTTFRDAALFPLVTFESEVGFEGATFDGDASFTVAELAAGGDFTGAEFDGDVDFEDADCRGVDFSGVDLAGVTFRGADLEGGDFEKANLTDADLSDGSLATATLERALLNRADLFGTDLRGAAFYGAVMGNAQIDERTGFDACNVYEVLYDRIVDPDDLRAAVPDLPDESGESDAAELAEELADRRREWLTRAAGQYRIVEQLARTNAFPDRVSENFVRRQDVHREQHRQAGRWGRWLRATVSRTILLYGESPWRVIASSVAVVLGFALLYPLGGWMRASDGTTVTYDALLAEPLLFGKSVYYSTLTFTTLGFGDFQPVGVGQALTTVETALGTVLIALLVFVFGRRASR